MDVDADARKATLTLKKGLIESRLPAITSCEGIQLGVRSHGWVSGITDKGIFVGFYNKVKGLVPPSEVLLEDGAALQNAYSIGQVLKCTVTGCDVRRGLRLTLGKRRSSAGKGSSTGAAHQVGTPVDTAADCVAEPAMDAEERDPAEAIVGDVAVEDGVEAAAEHRSSARLVPTAAVNQVLIDQLLVCRIIAYYRYAWMAVAC
jgi:predicted RNA-binding protein with RPS1 domain